MSLRMASATLARMAPRSAGAMRGQGPWSKASRAAATARSMSAFWASGTRPTSSSVVGDTTSNTEVEDGSTHSPPMNRRSYDFTGPPWLAPDLLRSSLGRDSGPASGWDRAACRRCLRQIVARVRPERPITRILATLRSPPPRPLDSDRSSGHRHRGMTMLSPLDDYPVHQISEPMRFVGTSDRNFYDRYYFNIHGADDVHGTDDELFAVIGVGQYPNLSVADAFVSVLWGDDHRVVRSSKTLGADRMDPSVGPIRVEVHRRASSRSGHRRAQRVGHRARRRLRRVLRGPPRVTAFRPPVLPGHLRLHPVRPGGLVDRHPQGRRPGAPADPRPLVGIAGPVVGSPPGRGGRAPGHPGHRYRGRILLDLRAGPVRGPRHGHHHPGAAQRRADHAGRPPGLPARVGHGRPSGWAGPSTSSGSPRAPGR